MLAFPADYRRIPLVKLHRDSAGHMLLALVDRRLEYLPLGCEPEAVVDEARVARHQLVLEVHRAAVERDALDPAMPGEQDRAARRFVNAAGLHPDETVLDQIEPADAIVMAELVEPFQQGSRRILLPIYGNGIATLEIDGDRGWLVRRVLGGDRPLMDIFRRVGGRVLEHFSLGRRVQQIRVDRKGRVTTLVLGDRDLMLLCEVQQRLAAGELPLPPRGDHPDVRLQRVIAELEANLVVPLAGRAMANGV